MARVDWEIVVSILLQIVAVPTRAAYPNLLDTDVARDQGPDPVRPRLS